MHSENKQDVRELPEKWGNQHSVYPGFAYILSKRCIIFLQIELKCPGGMQLLLNGMWKILKVMANIIMLKIALAWQSLCNFVTHC